MEISRHRKMLKVMFTSHCQFMVIAGPRLLICQVSPLTSSGCLWSVYKLCASSLRETSKSRCAVVVSIWYLIHHPAVHITPSLTLSLPSLVQGHQLNKWRSQPPWSFNCLQAAVMNVVGIMSKMCQHVKYQRFPCFLSSFWETNHVLLWTFCSFAGHFAETWHEQTSK